MQRPEAACPRDFRKSPKPEAREAICVEKPLRIASGVGRGLRESPGWVNSVSHVDGDSGIVPTCQLSGVGGGASQ